VNPARRAWYYVQYLAFRFLLFLIAVVPLGVALGITSVLARIGFWILPNRRRATIANVLQSGITDDPAEARRIAAASFRTFLVMITEALIARKRLNASNWEQHVTIAAEPETTALMHEPGVGVIVATAHVGNWEILARAASIVKPLRAIYRPFHNPYFDASIREDRQGEHLTLIPKYDADFKRFLRPLSEGEVLAIMIDQHAGNGIYVDFFGRPAKTTTSVAMLHLVTKCPLVVAYAVRTGPLRYELRSGPPLRFQRSGDREADVREITQTLTREIERIAVEHPEQYMWGHRRWK
jgi:KDO2-lipid IV(A) lauroyltransferase